MVEFEQIHKGWQIVKKNLDPQMSIRIKECSKN